MSRLAAELPSMHGGVLERWAYVARLSAAATRGKRRNATHVLLNRAMAGVACERGEPLHSARPMLQEAGYVEVSPSQTWPQRIDSGLASAERSPPANGISTGLSPGAVANAQILLAPPIATAYVWCPSTNASADTTMLNLDDELPLGGTFDIERTIIDPDYRRLVLANLRADPSAPRQRRCVRCRSTFHRPSTRFDSGSSRPAAALIFGVAAFCRRGMRGTV